MTTPTPTRAPTPAPARRTTYADLDAWRAYERWFPERMRADATTSPREEWWSWRGLDVHLDRMENPSARLKVIVLHGVGAYGRVMAPAAVLARKHGFETVAPDLPGFGLTRVPRRKLTYELWIDCVTDLIELERARDDRPVALFGVSLGGLLGYQAAARSRHVAGLVATTLADPREPAVRKDFAKNRALGGPGLWLLQKLRWLTDGLPLPMAHVSKMDRISNTPELSRLVSRDRMGGGSWVPARFLRTMLSAAPALEPEAFDVCPVLLAHPGEDRMTAIAHSQRFFERLAGAKRMVVLDGASHMPTESPGIDQLESSVLAFLDSLDVTTARAPGAC
ncbi:MAG: alpha/beta hydrolase [Myxococcota bacterium]